MIVLGTTMKNGDRLAVVESGRDKCQVIRYRGRNSSTKARVILPPIMKEAAIQRFASLVWEERPHLQGKWPELPKTQDQSH